MKLTHPTCHSRLTRLLLFGFLYLLTTAATFANDMSVVVGHFEASPRSNSVTSPQVRNEVVRNIQSRKVGIMGLCLEDNVALTGSDLPGYDSYTNSLNGNVVGIWWDANRFACIEKGCVYFHDRSRRAVCVLLRDKLTHQRFYVFESHLPSEILDDAAQQLAATICNKEAGVPVIMMGYFGYKAGGSSDKTTFFKEEAGLYDLYRYASKKEGSQYTVPTSERCDFIYGSKSITTQLYSTVASSFNYHSSIYATIKFEEQQSDIDRELRAAWMEWESNGGKASAEESMRMGNYLRDTLKFHVLGLCAENGNDADLLGLNDKLYARVSMQRESASQLHIIYNKERLALIEDGSFMVGKRAKRPCLWARMRDKHSNREFYVFAEHVYGSETKVSFPMLAQQIRDLVPKGIPAILLGNMAADLGQEERAFRLTAEDMPSEIFFNQAMMRDALFMASDRTGEHMTSVKLGLRTSGIFMRDIHNVTSAAIVPTSQSTHYGTAASCLLPPHYFHPIRLATYNVWYYVSNAVKKDEQPDIENTPWSVRGPILSSTIQAMQADIYSFDEVSYSSQELIKESLPGFTFIGTEQNTLASETTPGGAELEGLAFRNSRFTLLKDVHFVLSDTPYIGGSRIPNSDMPAADTNVRSAVLAKLMDNETEQVLYVVKVHYPNTYKTQLYSSEVVLRVINEHITEPDAPVFLMGDTNCVPYHGALTRFLSEGFTDCYGSAEMLLDGPEYTGSSFTADEDGNYTMLKIDIIFCRNATPITSRVGDFYFYPSHRSSDHLPYIADVIIEGKDKEDGIPLTPQETGAKPSGSSAVFDLSGRRVRSPRPDAPGVYIMDGKKVYIK